MKNEKYIIHFICTGNSCRSRMAQGITESIARERNLEERLDARSSGMLVNDLDKWGETRRDCMPMDIVMKMFKIGFNNGIHKLTEYADFVEYVVANEEEAREREASDGDYSNRLNKAASRVHKLLHVFDKTSTMILMAEHGLMYPEGAPRQFVKDGSDIYVPMEQGHVYKVKEVTGPRANVSCFDLFLPVGEKMEGSLSSIVYNDGMLDVRGFRKIYNKIERGCHNLMEHVEKQLRNG